MIPLANPAYPAEAQLVMVVVFYDLNACHLPSRVLPPRFLVFKLRIHHKRSQSSLYSAFSLFLGFNRFIETLMKLVLPELYAHGHRNHLHGKPHIALRIQGLK